MPTVLLAHGSGTAACELPEGVRLEVVGRTAGPDAPADAVAHAVREALAAPEGAAAFRWDDPAPATATIVVAPAVPAAWAIAAVRAICGRLASAGVAGERLTVCIAREPDGCPGPRSLCAALGASALPVRAVEAVGVAPAASLGVASASLRVVLSRAVPHPIAGWAGGADVLVPGTLPEEGARSALRGSLDARVGPDGGVRSARGRPRGLAFDSATRAAARALGRSAAVVLGETAKGAPWAFAGDLESAHAKAVLRAGPDVVRPAPEPADLLLLGSGETEGRDVPSALPALDLVLAAARPGAPVLWCVPATEGPGGPRFLSWFESGRLERHLAALRRAFAPEGLSAYALRSLAARHPIHVVGALGVDDARPLGLWPFADAPSALAHALGMATVRRALAIPRPDLVAFA